QEPRQTFSLDFVALSIHRMFTLSQLLEKLRPKAMVFRRSRKTNYSNTAQMYNADSNSRRGECKGFLFWLSLLPRSAADLRPNRSKGPPRNECFFLRTHSGAMPNSILPHHTTR